jgi:hypothetical protein
MPTGPKGEKRSADPKQRGPRPPFTASLAERVQPVNALADW